MPDKNRHSDTDAPYLEEGLPETYRRIRRAWAQEEPAPEAIAAAFLGHLVELQHAATTALRAAAGQARAPELARRLEELARKQERYGELLAQGMRDIGGAPPRPEESRVPLPAGEGSFGYAQDDDDLLDLLKRDLETVADAYHQPIPPALPEPQAELVQDLKMRQERMRREWLSG
jgi:hypothetical protein